MGILRNTATGMLQALDAENVVGRSPRAAMRLDARFVSSQHASLNWRNDAWELRDLGSKNGTLVDDFPVAGPCQALRRGALIVFGRSPETWELVDDSEPRPCLLPEQRGVEPVVLTEPLLPLPSPDAPEATLLSAFDGNWSLEFEHSSVALVTGQLFEVGGKQWRFFCPSMANQSSTVDWSGLSGGKGALLRFRVSQDEEHVEIFVLQGREERPLGAREHNYLLLTLARRRIADAQSGEREGLHGWLYQDELLDALRISPEQLNLDVFRIRRRFAAISGKDGANIIERRPRIKQLRIGWPLLAIERI